MRGVSRRRIRELVGERGPGMNAYTVRAAATVHAKPKKFYAKTAKQAHRNAATLAREEWGLMHMRKARIAVKVKRRR